MDQTERQALQAENLVKEKIRRVLRQIAEGEPEIAFRTVEFIRKECQFEMNLIGTRITWLLAAQAFLVTASVFALANALNINVRHGALLAGLTCTISILGGGISIKTLDAVDRAKYTLDLWHGRMRGLYESLGPDAEPAWVALILGRWTEFNDPFHQESLRLSNVILPRIFTVFWTILLIASLTLAIQMLLQG